MDALTEPWEAASRLAGELADWLPGQRWFAAKGRALADVTPVSATVLHRDGSGEVRLDHLVLRVTYPDGSPEDHYQVLVGYRRHLPERLEHVRIGEIGGGGDAWVAFDGLWEEELAAVLLRFIAAGEERDGMRFAAEEGAAIGEGTPARVIDSEQSNSSVVYDEAAILKLFRRIVPGQNPDLEVARALRRARCEHVPELLGEITGRIGSQPVSYGMLSAYAVNSADGWSMASASVRDLMAERDLHADEVGGDFAGEAYRLGEAVACVHNDLARALGTGTLDADGLASLGEQMEARLATAVHLVPELEPYENALSDAYRALSGVRAPVPTQRVHGDLHLGQVLRTPTTWLLIDFEGEPVKSLMERVRQDSPVRDVAGMLRSFDYAAAHLMLAEERNAPAGASEEHDSQLRFRIQEWIHRNRNAFCDGYASAAGADPRDEPALLRAYELDKAVYETVYEVRNRPRWLRVPLDSVARLTA